jgi:uncharacterized membrane protein (UPF0182 family)
VIIAALALLLALRSIAVFWTDFLWFDSIDQTGVWSTLIFTRVWLVLAASGVAFLLFWGNLWLADRLSPRTGISTGNPDEEIIERFQDWMNPRVRWVRIAVSAFFGIMLGLGAAVWWEDFLYWRHGGDFGIVDPIFNNDVSLYVFALPFFRSVFGWTFQLFLVISLVTAALHYLNGGIQVQSPSRRFNVGFKVHLSVLLAVLALLKAVGYVLDQWELLYSERGQVVGASFTDVNAQLPALRLLVIISIVAAIILFVNLRFRGWTLPAVALGLWLATSIGIGGIYPTLIQRLQVVPDEINKEVEFVEHNIEFTREAYGLTDVEVRDFAAAADLDVADLEANQPTIDNIRLWDPGVLSTTYSELQEIRTFYNIEDVDVDRYMVDGELTQVMVSARELDENNIPGGGWVNERLVYTHGFGAVVSPANEVTPEGQPAFLVQDIPPITDQDNLEIVDNGNRIYFSDQAQGDHVVAATNQDEVDRPIGGGEVAFNRYDGAGGIELGGIFRRAAFALRFGEVDMLISGQLTSDSKVLMVRNVRERIQKAAPFLYPDADPYLVVLDGRLVWIVDLYTVTNNYPYSASADTRRLNNVRGLPNRFNYIRNPVKGVVDAYDGTMDLYIVDDTDPLIQAQQRIFPSLFTSGAEMPQEIMEHLRYPEDLFRIQSDVYTLYHVIGPRDFFSNVDPWQIAKDPSDSNRTPLRGEGTFIDDGEAFRPMLPYYLLMKLPDDDELSFLIMQPFTPRDRPNMVSFLVAKSGPAEYGEIVDFTLPAESQQDGPGQVGDFINQNTEISQEFTLLGQGGSRVIQGNMLVIPIEESLLYVQPIYISASSAETEGIPEFKRAIVSFNGQIEMRDTLDQAIAAIFGEAPDGGTGGDGDGDGGDGGTTEVPEEVESLLQAAQEAFAEADAALRAGDLATYADKVAEAESFIERALNLIGETGESAALLRELIGS